MNVYFIITELKAFLWIISKAHDTGQRVNYTWRDTVKSVNKMYKNLATITLLTER